MRTDSSVKPRWRGVLHQWAFVASVPAGGALVALARDTASRLTAAIYAVSLTGVFGTSAAFHRGPWAERGRRRMQRLDHSMIYVLIAGTYTPFSVLVLGGAWAAWLLVAVWTGAAAGIAVKLFGWHRLRAVGAAMYIVLGWLVIVALPQIVRTLDLTHIALLVAGGVLYTAGSIAFMLRRPDPSPAVFGYHEVWHVAVVCAAACHYALILLLVRR